MSVGEEDPDLVEKVDLPLTRRHIFRSWQSEKSPILDGRHLSDGAAEPRQSPNGGLSPPTGVGMASGHRNTQSEANAGPSLSNFVRPIPAARPATARAEPHSAFAPLYLREEASGSDFSFSRPTSWSQAPTLTHPSSSSRAQTMSRSGSARRKDRPEDAVRISELRHSTGPITIPVPYRRYIEADGEDEQPQPKHGKGVFRLVTSATAKRESQMSLPGRPSMPSLDLARDDSRSLKVRSLDVLNPRPSLRGGLSPSASRRYRSDMRPIIDAPIPPRTPILDPEQTHRMRIDDLVETLDAATLRELMNRDQRRRDGKRQKQSRRAKQKLLDVEARQRPEQSQRELGMGAELDDAKATHSASNGFDLHNEHLLSNSQPPQPPVARYELSDRPKEVQSLRAKAPSSPQQPVHVATPPSKLRLSEDELTLASAASLPYASLQSSLTTSIVPESGTMGGESLHPPNDYNLQYTSSRESSEAPFRRIAGPSAPAGSRWSTILKPLNRHRSRGSDAASSITRKSIRYSEAGSGSDFSVNRQSTTHQDFRPPYSGASIRRRSGTPSRTKSRFQEDLPDAMPPCHGTRPLPMPNGDGANDAVQPTHTSIPDSPTLPALTYPALYPISPAPPEVAPMPNDELPPGDHSMRKSASGYSYEGEALSYSQSYASVDSESSWLRPSRRASRVNNQSSRTSLNTSRRHTYDGVEPQQGESLDGLNVLAEREVEGGSDRRGGGAVGSATPTGLDPKGLRVKGGGAVLHGNGEGPHATSEPEGDRYHHPVEAPTALHDRSHIAHPRPTTSNPFEHDEDDFDGFNDEIAPGLVSQDSLEDLDPQKTITHVRHISAGSARLLDIVAAGSAPGSKRSSRLGSGEGR